MLGKPAETSKWLRLEDSLINRLEHTKLMELDLEICEIIFTGSKTRKSFTSRSGVQEAACGPSVASSTDQKCAIAKPNSVTSLALKLNNTKV